MLKGTPQLRKHPVYIKLNVCLYILYANLQFYSDLDEILYI
jgi:hypothetical protein